MVGPPKLYRDIISDKTDEWRALHIVPGLINLMGLLFWIVYFLNINTIIARIFVIK